MPRRSRAASINKALVLGFAIAAIVVLTAGHNGSAAAQSVASSGSPIGSGCPAPELIVTRNAHLVVRYDGETDEGVCLQRVGGWQQAVRFGIWPANWPQAATAADAARHVLGSPPGTDETFTASYDWVGTNLVSSAVWRFTVTNLGLTMVEVAGKARAAARIGWDEQSLGRPYKAHAEFVKDCATGVILSQSFQVMVGSSTTATDFWSRYGGGLGTIPDFKVTDLR